VQFVSITVDPKYDTPEVFGTYSETFTKGDTSRWSFLTGSQQDIYELVVNGFGLYVKENAGEARMPGFEVAHTNRVVLVNEDGFPVGTFLGTREDDMAKLSRILTGREEFPTPGPSLSFSTTDGSALPIQFEVKPIHSEPDIDKGKEGDAPAASEPASEQSIDAVADTATAAQHNAAIDLKMPAWAKRLPTTNACLNTLAAILLLAGFFAIKSGRRNVHRNLMITAFLTSAIFLACYLSYHYALGKYTGEHGKKFPGEGMAAVIYQLILWPHIVLAVFVPVLAIRVFQHAFAERWDAHRKLAKMTFPIWMFVSVTGVVIYGMLYHWPA
jgi:protein SCO1/2